MIHWRHDQQEFGLRRSADRADPAVGSRSSWRCASAALGLAFGHRCRARPSSLESFRPFESARGPRGFV